MRELARSAGTRLHDLQGHQVPPEVEAGGVPLLTQGRQANLQQKMNQRKQKLSAGMGRALKQEQVKGRR